MDRTRQTMKHNKNESDQGIVAPELVNDAPSNSNAGLSARIAASVRSRIRRLFKKEDPNIYPFF